MKQRSKRLLLLLALPLFAAASCDEKGLGDAPIGETLEAPRDVIVMPDQFSNVAVVCHDSGFRVFVITADQLRVVEDEKCLR